jgi:hypothetical protein
MPRGLNRWLGQRPGASLAFGTVVVVGTGTAATGTAFYTCRLLDEAYGLGKDLIVIIVEGGDDG